MTTRSLSNRHVADALGLTHSAASRMRTGERVASPQVLQKLVSEFDADPRELLDAASTALAGDKGPWVALLGRLFGDRDDDPELVDA